MAPIDRASVRAPSPLALLEALPGIVWESDPAGDHTYVSPQALTILGHDPEAWTSQPGFWRQLVHPDDLRDVLGSLEAALLDRGGVRVRYRIRDSSGSYREIEDAVRVVERDGELRLTGLMLERARLEHQGPAKAATDHLEQVLDNLADGVYYVNRSRVITYWNQGSERLSGYAAGTVVGRHCYSNLLAHVDATGRRLCFEGCPLTATMEDGEPREAEVWLRHADGSRRPVRVRTAPVHDEGGVITGAVEVFSDATGLMDARNAAETARHEALTDALTGLPNRRFLDAALDASLDALRAEGTPFGLLLLDIDHFKRFNDEFGHAQGDEALRVVAETIRGALRAGDVAGRWGGEEFAILAASASRAGVQVLADRILALVRAAAVNAGGTIVPVTVSIGSTTAVPSDDAGSIFGRADAALYVAKGSGRDRSVLG